MWHGVIRFVGEVLTPYRKKQKRKTRGRILLDALYRILALPLTLFYDWTGNYVVAMILYAILIKIVLFPFGIKQQKNMMKQASIRPKEMAIRKKYAGRDDRKTQMKMQEELQALYQSENYNALSGCGPMLIQLPVVWILYRIVYGPLMYIKGMSADLCSALASKATEIAGSNFSAKYQLQWINQIRDSFDSFKDVVTDAGEKFSDVFPSLDSFNEFFDKFKIFGADVSGKPWDALSALKDGFSVITVVMVLIPVLVFVSQYLSMRIIRKLSYQPVQDAQTAASMKIMDFAMPLMTMYMAFILPGILGIYWIVNSLLAIVQQVALKKLYPMPVFTEADYREAEKQLRGSTKAQKNIHREKVISPKSLHHIDDDDDDEPVRPAKKDDEDETEGDEIE